MADFYTHIEERLGLLSYFKTETSERSIHLHLFNTELSERKVTYNRYFTSSSSKTIYVERQPIKDERLLFYLSYSTKPSERSLLTSSFRTENSGRFLTYSRYFVEDTERSLSLTYSTKNERQILTRCIWNSYRFGFTKSWHISERSVSTVGYLYKKTADQRYIYAQNLPPSHSVRNLYFESCSLKWSVTINPRYEGYSIKVLPTYKPLFENEEVARSTIKTQSIKIRVRDRNANLILLIWNSKDSTFDFVEVGYYGTIYLPLEKKTEHTFEISGYIVPIASFNTISLLPICNERGVKYPSEKCISILEEAQSKGYFKITLLKDNYRPGEILILDSNQRLTLIPFKVQVSEGYFDLLEDGTKTFNLILRYDSFVFTGLEKGSKTNRVRLILVREPLLT